MNQVARRVRALKLMQDALCARLALETEGRWNADRMEIYRMEAGTRIVSDLEMLALARALECTPMWLFLGEVAEGGKVARG